MFSSRFTPEQKYQILKDYDSKSYDKNELLNKYNIKLQTIYNWKRKLNKNKRRYNKNEIIDIINESEKSGIPPVCVKYGLKPQKLYGWRWQYLINKQKNLPQIEKQVVNPETQTEIAGELAKYKEMCLALTYENYSLKVMLEKLRKQNVSQNYK